jgi:predicted ATP-grasp superfamily ATP-dependent carboligase
MPETKPRRRVLVTDGDQRATLAVVRSLGARGDSVHVCAPTARSLAGASRYAHSETAVADALINPAQFAADVQHIVTERKIDTLIPMTEAALLALLPLRAGMPGVLIPFTSADTFAAISDKQAVLAAAARVGISVPAQTVIADAGQAQVLDVATLQYPLVIKPARSVTIGSGDQIKLSVRHAESPNELRDVLDGMDTRAYPLLLQQRIIGPGVGIFVLLWNDELIARFAHRRLREKPPSGGVSVYRESIPIDEKLLNLSLALLREFSWQGVAMVEYKIDTATDTPYLMEINGRFWGSLQLAVDSGVDFPALLIETATGGKPAAGTDYRTGMGLRWFWGDVDHLLTRLRRSDAELALPPGSPSRWGAVRNFFRRRTGDAEEILRMNDAKPFLRETIQWFKQLSR